MIRSGKRSAIRPKAHLAPCANCPPDSNCPNANHYTSLGGCVVAGHRCKAFKSTDFSKQDRDIRALNRTRFFGSTHERLALTDLELSIARGQTDIVELVRQVPFRLGVGGMVYIADAVATLEPGGKYARRIYEPKGRKSLVYLFKRRIVELAYPDVEFYEVIQR